MDIILDSLYSIASDILYGFNRTCFVHLLSLLEGLGTFVMIGVMWFLIHVKVEIINYLRFHLGARVSGINLKKDSACHASPKDFNDIYMQSNKQSHHITFQC